MEPRNAKKLKRTMRTFIQLLIILLLAAILLTLLLLAINSLSLSRSRNQPSDPSLAFPLHPFIKKACPETIYSSLCRSTLSNMFLTNKHTTFLEILEFTINRTARHVKGTRNKMKVHFKNQDLNFQEKNALEDCMEMLDQTIYELREAVESLRSDQTGYVSYSNIKTLLSAAMTNENTCINGFLDLENLELNTHNGHRKRIQKMLTPISHMISNSLALIKHVEKQTTQKLVKKPRMMITKRPGNGYPNTMTIITERSGRGSPNNVTIGRRRKKGNFRPHVTVSSTGGRNYTTIGEAIAMAPNMSRSMHVIKITAGTYEENVVIPREKINIMLIGDGMNSTIITGSRNMADGFSTFASATLTVVGDKFMARDLTIVNTAKPEKHQAVALRVTSNAAFYRCEIISHQDTLYAHSLRQFYQNCSIQGTVDFIFGNAAAVFHNCKILVRKPISSQKNMITAQGREDPNQNTGISMQNCTIEASEEFNITERINFQTYLGRPWRNFSRTVIMDSYLGDLINPQGWFRWDKYSHLDTVEYIEYRNSGPGADTSHRVSWPGYRNNCTEDVIRQFGVGEFLHDADEWLQSTVFPLIASSSMHRKM